MVVESRSVIRNAKNAQGLGRDRAADRVRYIMLENSSIMLLSVTQKNLVLCPKLCSKNIALCSPDFYCIQHKTISWSLQVRSTNTRKLMPYNLLVLQLVSKRNILFTYLFYTFFSSSSMNLAIPNVSISYGTEA